MKLLDTVTLLIVLPEYGLARGQMGTIVEDLAPDVFLVEFSNDEGHTVELLPLEAELLRLYGSPAERLEPRNPQANT